MMSPSPPVLMRLLLILGAAVSSTAFTFETASHVRQFSHHPITITSTSSFAPSSSLSSQGMTGARDTKREGTTLKMGLFSSSKTIRSCGSRASVLKAFGNILRKPRSSSRRRRNNAAKHETAVGTRNKRSQLLRLITKSNSISKTQTKKVLKTIRQWSRKNRIRTLVAAMTVFCSTMISSTVGNNDISSYSHSSALQCSRIKEPISTVEQNVVTTASLRHLRTAGGGGEGISASQPSLAMKREVAKVHQSLHRQQSSLRLSSQTQTLQSHRIRTTTTAAAIKGQKTPMPMASVPVPVSSNAPAPLNEDDTAIEKTTKTFQTALVDLQKYMQGPKADTLLLLLATALITPISKGLGTSPILGFLAAGMLMGPNALGLISGIHTTETLAELGIVFFLFEMGIELSFDRLKSMKKDVFGLGLSQFACTALAVAIAGSLFGIPANALVVIGGGLALSSSAFVLQLLKDKNQLATRFGKAAFGVLLFQDLAVVPLLVVTPILAGGGQGLASALFSAVIKAAMALTSIAFAGRVLLNPLFKTVAGAKSQEAFLGVILLTVLSMSFMTEGLGLSNTLGAFLAGVLLSETKYRYQIEADIAPFRGILLGLFFVTVGFEIDFNLIASNLPLVAGIVSGILFIKTAVLTLLSLAFGLSLSTSQQTGLILCQGGEFAFVAFGLARNLGILDPATTKVLLTSVAITMAVTPFLADVGGKISKKLEEKSDFTHYLGQDRDANEIKESDEFVVVVGYGTVGRVVCDLLDRKFFKYVGLEIDPNKAIRARNKGLPVFYGDIGRPEVAEAFNVGKANAIIVTIADKDETNRAVISLRRTFPDMKIFARAKDADHAERLQRTLDVVAMVPVVPEDNLLLTLPFGGAVLRSLGAAQEEVSAILEGTRKEILTGRGLAEDEQSLVLAQLGITAQQAPGDKEIIQEDAEVQAEISSSEVARAAVEEKKVLTPMVAEVIEAATGVEKPSPPPPAEIEVEVEVVEKSSEMDDVNSKPKAKDPEEGEKIDLTT